MRSAAYIRDPRGQGDREASAQPATTGESQGGLCTRRAMRFDAVAAEGCSERRRRSRTPSRHPAIIGFSRPSAATGRAATIVGEGPEQVAADDSHGPPGETDRIDHAGSSDRTRVMSDAWIAASDPEPIAMPRSAWARAAASFTPSPTIATTRPPDLQIARIASAFSAGRHSREDLIDPQPRRRPSARSPRRHPSAARASRPSAGAGSRTPRASGRSGVGQRRGRHGRCRPRRRRPPSRHGRPRVRSRRRSVRSIRAVRRSPETRSGRVGRRTTVRPVRPFRPRRNRRARGNRSTAGPIAGATVRSSSHAATTARAIGCSEQPLDRGRTLQHHALRLRRRRVRPRRAVIRPVVSVPVLSKTIGVDAPAPVRAPQGR